MNFRKEKHTGQHVADFGCATCHVDISRVRPVLTSAWLLLTLVLTQSTLTKSMGQQVHVQRGPHVSDAVSPTCRSPSSGFSRKKKRGSGGCVYGPKALNGSARPIYLARLAGLEKGKRAGSSRWVGSGRKETGTGFH